MGLFPNPSTEVTIEAELNQELFYKIFGVDHASANDLFTLEFTEVIRVQARRHRKKRINKKWRKRYGYKTIHRKIQAPNCRIEMAKGDSYAET